MKMKAKEASIERIGAELLALRRVAIDTDLQQRAPDFAFHFNRVVDALISSGQPLQINSAMHQQRRLLLPESHNTPASTQGDLSMDANIGPSIASSGLAIMPTMPSPQEIITAISDAQAIPRLLTPPQWAFSIHEPNFSRRLHRAFMEQSYHFLSNYDTRREELSRSLRFQISRLDIDELRLRAKEYLIHSTGDPLEACKRRAAQERLGAGQVTENIPCSLKLLPASNNLEAFRSTQIHVSGYEGVWLGVDDVTVYLHRLGIPVQNSHNNTFVPWLVPNHIVADIMRNAKVIDVPRDVATDNGFPFPTQTPSLVTEGASHDGNLAIDSDLSDISGNDYDTLSAPAPMVAIDLDLSHLVDCLTRRSVWAGSGPVYKREDLYDIIRSSVIMWYRSQL